MSIETKNLENDLKDVYDKHLTKQVGEALKRRLEMVDVLETKNAELERLNSNQKDKLSSYQTKDDVYNEMNVRENDLKIRESAVAKKEVEQKISELEYKLATEIDKTNFSQNLAMGLVRNTNYRKSVFDGETGFTDGYTNAQGHWVPGLVKNTNKNYVENETQE